MGPDGLGLVRNTSSGPIGRSLANHDVSPGKLENSGNPAESLAVPLVPSAYRGKSGIMPSLAVHPYDTGAKNIRDRTQCAASQEEMERGPDAPLFDELAHRRMAKLNEERIWLRP
jgi:hypothetical protein